MLKEIAYIFEVNICKAQHYCLLASVQSAHWAGLLCTNVYDIAYITLTPVAMINTVPCHTTANVILCHVTFSGRVNNYHDG